jgi:hypothetical protein
MLYSPTPILAFINNKSNNTPNYYFFSKQAAQAPPGTIRAIYDKTKKGLAIK